MVDPTDAVLAAARKDDDGGVWITLDVSPDVGRQIIGNMWADEQPTADEARPMDGDG